MANPALVKTANGVGLSLNGVTIDPAGVTTANQALTWNGSAFVPGNVVPSFGNFTFSGNNLDINNAGTLGIALTTASSLSVGHGGGAGTCALTFNGQNITIADPTSYIYNFGNYYSAAQTATAGVTTQAPPSHIFRGSYWNGSAAIVYDAAFGLTMDSTGPTAHYSMQFPTVGERFQFNSAGNIMVANGLDSLTVASLNIGPSNASTIVIGNVTNTANINYVTNGLSTGHNFTGINVYFHREISASAGTPLLNSMGINVRSNYWNGSASTPYDCTFTMIPTATTPAGYLSIGFGGVEKYRLYDNSVFSVAAGGAFDVISAGNLNIGNGTATAINIGHAGCAVSLGSANVTQTTSITTAVTINSSSGNINTVSATLTSNSTATFTVNNNCVASSSSVVLVCVGQYSGTFGTNGFPVVNVASVAAGSFSITIYNAGSNSLNGTIQIHFAVL